ncbi:MAG: exonuclease subunit SbcD [Proteobacteria bacterium]|nr:MAG: exonuclease subunit SbcD [Pseudomonadota bacterium]
MKILHTSDWHLGRTLYGKKRYAEFEAFLNWLNIEIDTRLPDLVIIAGDIFDTTTPSNRAQELYYQFLCRVAASDACPHIAVIGGNHDSPTLLNAPKQLLKQLKIHVIGGVANDYRDEVIQLTDKTGRLQGILCAIPYLRDRDIRGLEEYELAESKDKNFMHAIKEHYHKVCEYAESLRQQATDFSVPIIATGHLFATGGKTLKDDGVRELYIGSLAQFGADDFPTNIDYLALGHLHIAQQIGDKANYRYSGSPIAMGFGEAMHPKIILEVDITACNACVNEITVPTFQRLARVSGDMESIKRQLTKLATENQSIWIEVDYTGTAIITNLQHELQMVTQNTLLDLVKIRNSQLLAQVLSSSEYADGIELNDLTPQQVFAKCLQLNEIPDEQRVELTDCFNEILLTLTTHDHKAE